MNTKLERLKAEKAALEAQIRQELGRERARQRKTDTRRKILAGAAVLDEAEHRQDFKNQLYRLLGRFLTKPEDRALFNLSTRGADGSGPADAGSSQARLMEPAEDEMVPG